MVSKRSDGRNFDRRTFIGTGMMAGAGLALGGMPFGAIAQDRRLTTVGGTAKTQVRQRARSAQGRRPAILVRAVRRADERRESVHAAAKARGVDRRERSLRDHVGRTDAARRHRAVARRDGAQSPHAAERRLPHRQRVHAGPRQQAAARHGLDARRRLLRGLRQLPALRRHEPREEGRRGRRIGEPSSEHLRLPAPRRHRRREVEGRDERRHPRFGRVAAMGARQHRELRRRRRSRHDLRPVGRRRKDDDRDGDAVGEGPVPPRDRAERLGVSRRHRERRERRRRAVPREARHQEGRAREDPAARLPARSRRRSTANPRSRGSAAGP